MVQVMSFDIKIHQISIDSKHKQCFDLIASDKVHYHLHCRKYSDNSGGNENILCFSDRIQLWFKSCPLTSKFIKFQLIASTSSVLTFLRQTKFNITCIVVNMMTIRVIMNIYCFSHCIRLWFKSCPFTPKFIKFQLIASTSSVLTSLRRTKFIIKCIVVNILTIGVLMKIY